MARLVECVPNFSEGRNRAVIDAIADAIKGVADVKLLDVDPGADTNRTVYTFVGPPEAVADAALEGRAQGLRADRHGEALGGSSPHGRHGRLPHRPDLGRDDGRVRGDFARDRPADRGRAEPAGLLLRVRRHVRGAAQPGEHPRRRVRGARAEAAGPGVGARRGAGPVRPEVRRAGRRRARVPDRLQRQPEHARPQAGQRDRAEHPRGRPPEARQGRQRRSSTSTASR